MKLYKVLSWLLGGCLCAFCFLSFWANICKNWGTLGTALEYGFFICVVYLAVGMLCNKLSNNGEVYLLMLLCLLLHLVLFSIAQNILGQQGQPIDSSHAFNALQAGKISYGHQLRCGYWVNYEILLSVLGCAFSKSIYTGQILNALCCSLAIYPIFKLSEIACDRKMARFVCLMVIFSPVLGLYSTALVGDYIASMLFVYALYFFYKCISRISSDGFYAVTIRDAVLIGVLLSVADVFKTIGFLLVGAMVVVLVFEMLQKMRIRQIMLLIAVFCIVLTSSHVMNIVINDVKWSVVGKERRTKGDFFNEVLYELVLGLNLERSGCYNRTLAKKLGQNARDGRMKMLKDAIKTDYKSYPSLMLVKFQRLYGTHTGIGSFISWFDLSTEDKPPQTLQQRKENTRHCPPWVVPYVDSGYLFFSFMMFLGALGLLFIGKDGWVRLMPGIASMVVVLGYVAMSLLIEGHGRYKCAVYPFFFLIIPYIGGITIPLVKIWTKTDAWRHTAFAAIYAATSLLLVKLSRESRKGKNEG